MARRSKHNTDTEKKVAYVGLYQAKELRRNLLMTAKELLILLKDLQVQKIKNKARLNALNNINTNLKGIDSLSNNVLELLPKSKFGLVSIKSKNKKSEKLQTTKEDELSTIDNQIKKIEALLNNI